MDATDQKTEHVNETKIQLLMQILKKSDPKMIHIFKLLAETCKKDWVDIFKWIFGSVDHVCLNIGEVMNIACRDGAFNIIKWSLENIDIQLLDADNVTVESSGFGWVECVVLIQKHCHRYVFDVQASIVEACTYDRLHVAEWRLQNLNYQLFDLPLLLQAWRRTEWMERYFSLACKTFSIS
ncbi:unnamed protein product [Mytilus coruscus]|uniref:Uncharacterized protein n=1 Tax=Mytilus coruscus TaxID=42192 RepID=A0A6J8C8G3_MYTCO|nr:unnamed protein product [Mytilus coruscus]